MNELQVIEDRIIGCGTSAPTREMIEAAERKLAAMDTRIMELPIVHHFVPGMYAREMHIPAGVMLTGKTHRHAHMNVLLKGDITVWTEEGMKRLQAPYSYESKPGTKRIGLAHTDVVWITYHFTFETDLERIEAEVIEPSDNLIELNVQQVLK